MSERDYFLQYALEAALFAAAAAGCFFLHPAAAVLTAAAGLISLAVQAYFRSRRAKDIVHICDEIGKILDGAEQIELHAFEEGEFGILSSEISKMTVRLREQNTALKKEQQFMKESLEDISHQLRTPLTSVMLLLDMMGDPQRTKQERAAQLRDLQSLLEHMQWLIEILLGLSRMDAGAVRFQQTEIHCRALCAAALEPISISLELKEIDVQMNVSENAAFTGDFQYCTEALTNLLKNCMEHTPAGGTICIKSAVNPVYTGLLITDSGSGIAQDDLPHIFERFYRGGSFSKSGYGIGLAFAQKVITSQGGSIQVSNAEPHGARFDIRFYRTVT